MSVTLRRKDSKIELTVSSAQMTDSGTYFCLTTMDGETINGQSTDLTVRPKRAARAGKRGRRESERQNLYDLLTENSWLQWAAYTVKSVYPEGNCYICASRTPKLYVIPLPDVLMQKARETVMGLLSRPWCLLILGNSQAQNSLMKPANSSDDAYEERGSLCRKLYPDIEETEELESMGYEIDENAGFECFIGERVQRDLTGQTIDNDKWRNVGEFEGRCSETWRRQTPKYITEDNCVGPHCTYLFLNFVRDGIFQDIPLADVYWVCGKAFGLRRTLPKYWVGKCAWVRVVQATHILPMSQFKRIGRVRRATSEAGTPTQHTFQDVPEEFAAQSAVLAGFLGAIPFVGAGLQTAKNAKWINYVYYNQLRFLNYTIDALVAMDQRINVLAVEVSANTKMTLENRLVLDWMLAKEGGACAVVGENCCTFIPGHNSSSDTFGRAMDLLKELQKETHDNAGQEKDIDLDLSDVNSFLGSVQDFFGSAWEGLSSIFGSLGATILGWILKILLGVALLIAVCCCLVSCCGKICSATVTKAVEKQLVVLGPMEEIVGQGSGSYEAMDLRRPELCPITEQPRAKKDNLGLHSTLRCQYQKMDIV